MSWEEYYQVHRGRPVRPVFSRALQVLLENTASKPGFFAIDLGCGAGIESAALLKQGFRVLALDRERSALDLLSKLVPPEAQDRLQVLCQSFESLITLPQANFVYSYHSLPFCEKNHFQKLLSLVKSAVTPGGIFAGSLFGCHDDWVKAGHCSGLSESEFQGFLEGFQVLECSELNQIGPTALDGDKHWHYWTVIARRLTTRKGTS